MAEVEFLDGVPVAHVLERIAKAGRNEVESGKLVSPESSASVREENASFMWARSDPAGGVFGEHWPQQVETGQILRAAHWQKEMQEPTGLRLDSKLRQLSR